MVRRRKASLAGSAVAALLAAPGALQPGDARAAVAGVERVGGVVEAEAERLVDPSTGQVSWTAGRCRIETPLPEGYAPPTPPGALDIKRYAVVRRALVAGDSARPGDGAFWPLFRHIGRRDIAMTAPVEMDYHGLRPGGEGSPEGWSMAFLYRHPGQGPLGRDGADSRVLVADVGPVTVLAAGFRGAYRGAEAEAALASLGEWLDAHPEWEVAGDVRSLHYNGPMTRSARKWGEVQVPIRPRAD